MARAAVTGVTSIAPRTWLERVVARYVLPTWFAFWALRQIGVTISAGGFGLDTRIYYRAAVAWVSGGDPWAASVTIDRGSTFHFAGLPPTVLAFAPLAPFPEVAAQWAGVIVSAVAGVWIVRRLALPWPWLLFPPMWQGVLSANPGIVLLALLLTRWPAGEALAAAMKVYALVPMAARARWLGIAVFVAACAVSAAVFPSLWTDWLAGAGTVTGRLVSEAEGGTGATAYWWLVPPTIIAVGYLAFVDRQAAGWLAIPALWPSAQFHYSVMALPVMRLWPAFLFAAPIYGMPAVAVMLHAWMTARDRTRRHRGAMS